MSSKKEVASSSVNKVKIEFDKMTLASILEVPGNNGIYNYMKGFWEESKYYNPLETTRRFAYDDTITKGRRVKSIEMKPFTRLLHLFEEEKDSDSKETEEDDNSEDSTPAAFDKEPSASERG
ncbi:hypothetical protein Dimus_022155 [Dionaea muscipula]